MNTIETTSAPAAAGPYSQAISANGLIFCSGQLGIDPATGKVPGVGAAAQAEQALKNIAAVLLAAGSGMDKVVKATLFLTDMNEFSAVNEIYARAFGGHKPARSCVEVAALPKGAKVEVEVTALA